MIRHMQLERNSWRSIVEGQGLIYHTPNGNRYWDESAYYEFTSKEVDSIEATTNELWNMPIIFLLLLGLPIAEWLLRRKWGIV